MSWLLAYVVVSYPIMWLGVRSTSRKNSPNDARAAIGSAVVVLFSPLTCLLMIGALIVWLIAASLGYKLPMKQETNPLCQHGANGRAATAAARHTTPTE